MSSRVRILLGMHTVNIRRRRQIRLNTWAGRVQYRPYEAVRNTVCIEDPFDATDNPGRSLALTTVDFVADEFLDAAQNMNALRDEQRAH